MTEVSLEFISQQLERVLSEQRAMRDELRVNSAMVQRCSNAVVDQAQTLNAIHQWMIGINASMHQLNDRVTKLEDAR